jgi:hypothetical protein
MKRLLCSFFLLAACSSDETTGPAPIENQLPVWSDAPAEAVSVGEGRSLALPLTTSDPDGGEVLATLVAPAGFEAEVIDGSLSIHAGYGAPPGELSVDLADDEGEHVVVKVALTSEPLAWIGHVEWQTADGPEEREHGAVIYDEASQQAFLFGGSGYHPQFTQLLDDVWRYDVVAQTWTEVTPVGDPLPAGGSRRFAGRWGAGEGYLHGGYGTGDLDELFHVAVEGDTLRFEEVTQMDPKPAPRSLHGFAYDPEGDTYYLFGGVSSLLFGDTWQMKIEDGTAVWTQLMLDPTPSGRYGFFTGFDEVARRFIVYAGAQGGVPLNPATDTWALETGGETPRWVLLTDPNNTPPGRRNGCAIWDPTGPRLVVFGGTADGMTTSPGLHIFDARPGHESWVSPMLTGEPQVRSSGFGFFDGERVHLGFGNDNAVYRDWGILGYAQ